MNEALRLEPSATESNKDKLIFLQGKVQIENLSYQDLIDLKMETI